MYYRYVNTYSHTYIHTYIYVYIIPGKSLFTGMHSLRTTCGALDQAGYSSPATILALALILALTTAQ